MAEGNYSGLGSTPLASPALLKPLPRSLSDKEESEPEYRISDNSLRTIDYGIKSGNSYETARQARPLSAESLYSPRTLSLSNDSYRLAA